MRAREVWVHAVDLDVGLGFDDIPEDLLYALVDDVTRTWQRRGQTPDVRLSGGWRVWGSGTLGIAGRLPDLAAYLTGRGAAAPLTFGGQSAAVLPAWL